jgi:DNA-binding CsgD family transcriptional regulator
MAPHMSDDLPDNRSIGAAIALFATIFALILWDLIRDYKEGANWFHLGVELLVLLTATIGIVFLWQKLTRTTTDLAEALVEAEKWRQESRELIRGLGAAIEKQFTRWELTKAEAEVGFLLLKGLSHKEIATIRETSERTAREQARTLYRKSGLSGRSALSAFFLEDLLPGQNDETE